MIKPYWNHLTACDFIIKNFLWKLIWKIKASPRIVFFAWEAAFGCILTTGNLIKRGNIIVDRYIYAKEQQNRSTTFHMLFYLLPVMLFRLYSLGLNRAMVGSVKKEIWTWKGIHGDKSYNMNLDVIPLATF